MKKNTFECDFCNKQTPSAEKHWLLCNRPSEPYEIVSTMWGCAKCGKDNNLHSREDIAKIDDEFDEKGYANFGGHRCIFLSL